MTIFISMLAALFAKDILTNLYHDKRWSFRLFHKEEHFEYEKDSWGYTLYDKPVSTRKLIVFFSIVKWHLDSLGNRVGGRNHNLFFIRLKRKKIAA